MFTRFLIFTTLLMASFRRTDSLCNLCANGVEGINWPHHHVDSSGKTCVQKSIDMAFIGNENSAACQSQISQFRGRCCGSQEPGPIQQTPTLPPVYNGPTGPYRRCNLCRDGDYPSETSMVITMLYIGSGSCAQFYDYGQGGFIQNHLCDPLQYFAYEPCGCGEFNRNRPGQGQQAPPGNTPRVTPRPTPRPTNRPAQNPNNGSPGNNKAPDSDGKDNMKLGNDENRGGHGGQRQRRLKGVRGRST